MGTIMSIMDLPFPNAGRSINYILNRQLFLDQWMIEIGTSIRLYTDKNFGYVILPEGTKDVRGFVIPRQLFRW